MRIRLSNSACIVLGTFFLLIGIDVSANEPPKPGSALCPEAQQALSSLTETPQSQPQPVPADVLTKRKGFSLRGLFERAKRARKPELPLLNSGLRYKEIFEMATTESASTSMDVLTNRKRGTAPTIRGAIDDVNTWIEKVRETPDTLADIRMEQEIVTNQLAALKTYQQSIERLPKITLKEYPRIRYDENQRPFEDLYPKEFTRKQFYEEKERLERNIRNIVSGSIEKPGELPEAQFKHQIYWERLNEFKRRVTQRQRESFDHKLKKIAELSKTPDDADLPNELKLTDVEKLIRKVDETLSLPHLIPETSIQERLQTALGEYKAYELWSGRVGKFKKFGTATASFLKKAKDYQGYALLGLGAVVYSVRWFSHGWSTPYDDFMGFITKQFDPMENDRKYCMDESQNYQQLHECRRKYFQRYFHDVQYRVVQAVASQKLTDIRKYKPEIYASKTPVTELDLSSVDRSMLARMTNDQVLDWALIHLNIIQQEAINRMLNEYYDWESEWTRKGLLREAMNKADEDNLKLFSSERAQTIMQMVLDTQPGGMKTQLEGTALTRTYFADLINQILRAHPYASDRTTIEDIVHVLMAQTEKETSFYMSRLQQKSIELAADIEIALKAKKGLAGPPNPENITPSTEPSLKRSPAPASQPSTP